MTRLLAALLGVMAVGCVKTHSVDLVPAGDGPLVGVYKAAIDDGSGVIRRARLSLWAERPDRLHAELIGPVGGVSHVLDAGGGRVCVVEVATSTAYAGEDSTAAIEALTGVRTSVADAVAAFLEGVPPPGLTLTRDGPAGGALPVAIRIADGSRSLALTRVRFERGTGDPHAVGTGTPPGGLAVRPIESLRPRSGVEPERSGGIR